MAEILITLACAAGGILIAVLAVALIVGHRDHQQWLKAKNRKFTGGL